MHDKMLSSIYLGIRSMQRATYKYTINYSTVKRTHSDLCLLSANDGKRDSFDLNLFFTPLQDKHHKPRTHFAK